MNDYKESHKRTDNSRQDYNYAGVHMKKITTAIFLVIICAGFFTGCSRSSERAAYNLDYQAEEFRLLRRIAAINGITDKPLFEIVGYCSIETANSYVSGTMEVVCETDNGEFTKDFIYLSDNVLIVVEQISPVGVPRYHYQMVFAPQSLLPVPEIVGGRLGE